MASAWKIYPLLSFSSLCSQSTHTTVLPLYALTFHLGADYEGKIIVSKRNYTL